MRGGKLRHRVNFQSRTPTTDGYGGQVGVWDDFLTDIPASIEPLTSRELLAAQAVQSEVTHKVTVRYQDGLDSSMRIVFGERVFTILGPPLNRDERNRELQFMASEGMKER